MVDILATNGINLWTVNICKSARKHLVIISPYLKINEKLRMVIEDSITHGAKLTVIYGKKELDKNTRSWISSLPYCNLGYLKNLHAKAVLNEDYALLSSMNLYEYSQVNNDELGVVMSRIQNPEYKDLMHMCIDLINHSEKQLGEWDIEDIDKLVCSLFSKEPIFIPVDKSDKTAAVTGCMHCIRCGTELPEDCETVYCGKCLGSWKKYRNTSYKEKNGHCLVCGKEMSVTAEKPSCPDCYRTHSADIKARCRKMVLMSKKA